MTWSTMPVVGRSTTCGSGARAPAGGIPPSPAPSAPRVGLADGPRPAPGIGRVDEPEVHGADRVLVVVEQADEPERRLEIGGDLLAPLAPQTREGARPARGEGPA